MLNWLILAIVRYPHFIMMDSYLEEKNHLRPYFSFLPVESNYLSILGLSCFEMNWKTTKLDTYPCRGLHVVSRSCTNCNEILSACTRNLFSSFVNYSACNKKNTPCVAVKMKIPLFFAEINTAGGESFHLWLADNVRGQISH